MIDLQTVAFAHCSWCGRRLSDTEIPLGIPLDMGQDEKALLGRAVEFGVEGYVLTGFLFAAESKEKREGLDLGMIACSDECADKAADHGGTAGIKLQPLSEATVKLKMLRP